MTTSVACTLYLMVDEEGDFAVGKMLSDVDEAYGGEFDKGDAVARRIVKVVVNVVPPCTVTLTGDAPDGDGAATLEVQ